MLHQLRNIGLGDKEAKVYIAMLELGPAPVLDIAAKAGVNRPTAYVQIESLKKRGLTSSQTRGKKQLFIAESPDQLEVFVNKEIADSKQKKETLADILPDLKSLFNLADEKPQVRFFEGKEGLLRMQEDFLKVKGKEVLGIFAVDDVVKLFPEHLNAYTTKRVQKRIRSRSIYTSQRGPILDRQDAKLLRQAKFVKPNQMPFSADITIYDNKVAIAALKGKISGTIIENSAVADSFRGFFELVWNLLD